MKTTDYINRTVSQLINEFDEEIEMEIIQYHDHYKVVVTICQEEPPFNDFIGIGTDRKSKRRAAKKALVELYREAYPELFKKEQA
jgi:hypothetical protein